MKQLQIDPAHDGANSRFRCPQFNYLPRKLVTHGDHAVRTRQRFGCPHPASTHLAQHADIRSMHLDHNRQSNRMPQSNRRPAVGIRPGRENNIRPEFLKHALNDLLTEKQ